MLSLLSYGEALVDLLPSSQQHGAYLSLAGGAPANVAVAFAKLGGKSYFAGGISGDHFGQMLLHQLVYHSVDTEYVQIVEQANTALVLVSLDKEGERSFNFYRHQTADTQYQQQHIAQIAWEKIGIFHLCSNTLTTEQMFDSTSFALTQAKTNEVLVSFDVNLRQQLWHDLSLLASRVETCIHASDIVKFSKEEALYLAESAGLTVKQYLSNLLTVSNKLILVTDGANSVEVICQNFCVNIEVPKIKAVDTTAAGDSFIASFLFYVSRRLSKAQILSLQSEQTRDVVCDAMNFAAKCGALTCQKKGAFSALPASEELLMAAI